MLPEAVLETTSNFPWPKRKFKETAVASSAEEVVKDKKVILSASENSAVMNDSSSSPRKYTKVADKLSSSQSLVTETSSPTDYRPVAEELFKPYTAEVSMMMGGKEATPASAAEGKHKPSVLVVSETVSESTSKLSTTQSVSDNKSKLSEPSPVQAENGKGTTLSPVSAPSPEPPAADTPMQTISQPVTEDKLKTLAGEPPAVSSLQQPAPEPEEAKKTETVTSEAMTMKKGKPVEAKDSSVGEKPMRSATEVRKQPGSSWTASVEEKFGEKDVSSAPNPLSMGFTKPSSPKLNTTEKAYTSSMEAGTSPSVTKGQQIPAKKEKNMGRSKQAQCEPGPSGRGAVDSKPHQSERRRNTGNNTTQNNALLVPSGRDAEDSVRERPFWMKVIRGVAAVGALGAVGAVTIVVYGLTRGRDRGEEE